MDAPHCPDDTLLGAIVDGTLAEGSRAGVAAHISTCGRCRSMVSQLLTRSSVRTRTSAPPSFPREGATIAGRYTLGRMLGRGGMGVVYEAIQLDLGRAVAVKLLPATADARASFRFAREARTLAQLAHPNIVQLFDYGTDLGTGYVVMERLEGRPLSAALRAEGPFAVARAVRVSCEMLRALSVTHRAGVVHRDIKPANVFLLPGDGVKVLDFGIASTNDGSPRLTMTGVALGTPAYMSPEQVLAAPVDARTDLYAVGVCLFEMLTGRRPFRAESAMQVIAQVILGGPPRADSVRSDIPADLADVVERAMARDPAARFANAEAFAAALGALGTGQRAAPPAAVLTAAYPRTVSAASPSPDWGLGMTAPLPSSGAGRRNAAMVAAATTPRRSRVAPILGGAVFLVGAATAGAVVAQNLRSAAPSVAGAQDASASAASPASVTSPASTEDAAPTNDAVAPSSAQSRGAALARGGSRPSSAAAISASCSCVNAAGGPVCVGPRIPDCECRTGVARLCPQPWSAGGRCPVGAASGSGTSAYSAPGRKDGEACLGFQLVAQRAGGGPADVVSSKSPVPGRLSCNFCSGHGDRFPGVNGASCSGTTVASTSAEDVREGTVVCK